MTIADGFHRVCASYHVNEDADIPCLVVDHKVSTAITGFRLGRAAEDARRTASAGTAQEGGARLEDGRSTEGGAHPEVGTRGSTRTGGTTYRPLA